MKNEQMIFVESLRRQELIVPSETAKSDTLPLDRVRQPKVHKLFQFEAIYLSEHLRKLKENFVRKFYPRNKLKRPLVSHEKLSSEAIKFMCDELLQRGQDQKAVMLASDVRDKEVFSEVQRMFAKFGLKKLVKQIQKVVQERESGSLYGGLSSRRGDTLDYFYDGNPLNSGGPSKPSLPTRAKPVKGKYSDFIQKPNSGFNEIYQEINEKMESVEIQSEDQNEKDEEKENEMKKVTDPMKRSSPNMNNIFDNLYQKSLGSKSIKKVQY